MIVEEESEFDEGAIERRITKIIDIEDEIKSEYKQLSLWR